MADFFKKNIEKFLPLDLSYELLFEFNNKNDELPNENTFHAFLLQKKIELSEILERLASVERAIFLDEIRKQLDAEYDGIRLFFLKQIKYESIIQMFPEYNSKKEFSLNKEEAENLEKNSLYILFLTEH